MCARAVIPLPPFPTLPAGASAPIVAKDAMRALLPRTPYTANSVSENTSSR
jgi:hypothetical protein